MSKTLRDSKKIRGKCAIAIVCAVFMLCACSEEVSTGSANLPEGIESDIFVITEQDRKTEGGYDAQIDLNNIAGEFMITEGGDYLLYGSTEGKIVVEAYEDELVHLYLAGVNIKSLSGPAIYVSSAAKVIVTLMSDTDNTLSDSVDYKGYEDTESCLYCVADLTINGDGNLYVYGYYADGIRSKDRIKILSGKIDVQSKGDGIRGNDGILVKAGVLKIQSESNGLRTANQGTGEKGSIEICGGTQEITSGGNGIYSISNLYMQDCKSSIRSVKERTRAEGVCYITEGCMD
ncbi:MAG: carbohydrate-binding domain-containing protein [Lachnospiraceae bacterium]|nr:carbohydrate-binding domain-containing protein [Lachnospiraceae bacterium]